MAVPPRNQRLIPPTQKVDNVAQMVDLQRQMLSKMDEMIACLKPKPAEPEEQPDGTKTVKVKE